MKPWMISLVVFLIALPSSAAQKLNVATKFSTSRDLSAVAESNFKLKNTSASSSVVYGLYIRQLSSVTPGQSCASSTTVYSSSENVTGGLLLCPLQSHQEKKRRLAPTTSTI